jgi:hypothetical protein
MNSVLNCHNIAKYTEFYRFNVTYTGNAGCFKMSFTIAFQCYCVASVTKTFTLKGVADRSGRAV